MTNNNNTSRVEINAELENKKLNVKRTKTSIKWETHMRIPVSQLSVPPFQRELKESFIREKLENFDSRNVNEIKVSYRDGKYWVIDGNHTREILRRHYGEHHEAICQVFYGYSYIEDALLFASQNEIKNKVNIIYQLNALKEGKDELISNFYEVTEKCGFKLDYALKNYHIKAIRKALNIYEQCGRSLYERMLTLLSKTWKGKQASLQQNMLGGLAIILSVYGDEISNNDFIKTFGIIDPIRIIRDAADYRKDSPISAPFAFAKTIAILYNQHNGNNCIDTTKLNKEKKKLSNKVVNNTAPVDNHFSA